MTIPCRGSLILVFLLLFLATAARADFALSLDGMDQLEVREFSGETARDR